MLVFWVPKPCFLMPILPKFQPRVCLLKKTADSSSASALVELADGVSMSFLPLRWSRYFLLQLLSTFGANLIQPSLLRRPDPRLFCPRIMPLRSAV